MHVESEIQTTLNSRSPPPPSITRPTDRIVLHAIKIIILNNNGRASRPSPGVPHPAYCGRKRAAPTNGAIDIGARSNETNMICVISSAIMTIPRTKH